jgi:cyclic pyranopterin phosphate synthase
MSQAFTHFDEQGASRMVDVGSKPATPRLARVRGVLRMQPDTLQRIVAGTHAKGNVLEVARLAGIMGAKRTADLIPLCHTLPLEAVEIAFTIQPPDRLEVFATVRTTAKTGVEMEAFTAVTTCLLTVYDMCKAVDRGMVLELVQLEEKSGGQSGHFRREVPPEPGV